jgi:hypothetical protein
MKSLKCMTIEALRERTEALVSGRLEAMIAKGQGS